MTDQPQAVPVAVRSGGSLQGYAIVMLLCAVAFLGFLVYQHGGETPGTGCASHTACSCETYPWRVMRRQMGRPPYGVAGQSGEPGVWLENDQPAVKFTLLRDLVGVPHLMGEAESVVGSGQPLGAAPMEAK